MSDFSVCLDSKNINTYLKKTIKFGLLAFVFGDLIVNSMYVIREMELDDNTGRRYNRTDYELMVDMQNRIASLENDNLLIYSNYEYSSNDGLFFGTPTIDCFSSSYNFGLSTFLRSLGLNSFYNIMDDNGINIASAFILGVDYINEVGNAFQGTDLIDYVSLVSDNNGISLYGLENNSNGGFVIRDNIVSGDFSYNSFENINIMYEDCTGIGNIFERCRKETISNSTDVESGNVERFVIYPMAGRHLYFYVSPKDYLENDNICRDELYLRDELVARYVNSGNRYIIDLGYSDGSPLEFSFESDDKNEVFFYSLNYDSFEEAVKRYNNVLSNTVYSPSGVTGTVNSERDGELVLLIPYENGYNIKIDGVSRPYSDYRGGLIKIDIDEGEHSYEISYVTPGLVVGIVVSIFGFILLLIFVLVEKNKKIEFYQLICK